MYFIFAHRERSQKMLCGLSSKFFLTDLCERTYRFGVHIRRAHRNFVIHWIKLPWSSLTSLDLFRLHLIFPDLTWSFLTSLDLPWPHLTARCMTSPGRSWRRSTSTRDSTTTDRRTTLPAPRRGRWAAATPRRGRITENATMMSQR